MYPSRRFDDEIRAELRVHHRPHGLPYGDLPYGRNRFEETIDGSQPSLHGARFQYTALSYVWGPTHEDGSHLDDYIECDGRKLRVTSTLKHVLRRLRQVAEFPTKSTSDQFRPSGANPLGKLWVDAICINQDDLRERNAQVQMMEQIFSSCQDLVIWLGEPDDGELGTAQRELLESHADEDRDISLQYPSLGNRNETARHQHRVSVLQSLLSRPWFMRRWVIQEAADGDVPGHFLLGDTICPREFLLSQFEACSLLQAANPIRCPDRKFVESIFRLLYVYDQSQCEDPRDRIFALKALSRHRYTIQVDYDQDIRETYLNIVESVVFGNVDFDDFSVQFLGMEKPTLSPLQKNEAIAMLALSSCKKRKRAEKRRMGMELWLPDWTAETCFDSEHHRKTIEMCTSQIDSTFMDNTFAFSPLLLTSRNGHSYFGVDGIIVKQHPGVHEDAVLPHEHEPILQDSLSKWARDMYEAGKPLAEHYNARSDRMWLPLATYVNRSEDPPSQKTVAFILRPSVRAQNPFGERALYTLEACTTVDAPTNEDVIRIREEVSREHQASLTDYLAWERFCLE